MAKNTNLNQEILQELKKIRHNTSLLNTSPYEWEVSIPENMYIDNADLLDKVKFAIINLKYIFYEGLKIVFKG